MVDEEKYIRDFFRVANTDVLIIGIASLLVAIIIRTTVEATSWIRCYMLDSIYKKIVGQD
jgi:hypothetical protein